ncbi:MAG TPA: archaellin/type IV pilin N-terminal domain-containing protein [Dehalococcoidia bacterium]|nr:archaellin/type IV pilin N-terminal domain-containing protein [Dehalococcoidia bacterium]
MTRIKNFIRRLGEQRGITGLETAIILIAFVVVAAVFAFVVLSTGLFSSERSKETVYAGLSKTRGTMELSGAVSATSDGTEVTELRFDVTLAAGGSSVNWDETATVNQTIVSYIDDSLEIDDLTYVTTVISGDTDKLLEPGELFEIALTGLDALVEINANDTFTLQVQPPSGSYMVIERTLPPSIAETIVNLN